MYPFYIIFILYQGEGYGHTLNDMVIWGIVSSAGLFTSTIHAQDFRDIVGDRAIGRTTLPIAFPLFSRVSMLILVPMGTIFFCCLWAPPISISIILIVLSTFVGVRYVIFADARSDKVSYSWYNVSNLFVIVSDCWSLSPLGLVIDNKYRPRVVYRCRERLISK